MSLAGATPKVWFVGAGPGDPDLITVKGRDLIARAGAILYAGSLVSKQAMEWAPPSCALADSAGMTLDEITAWLIDAAGRHETVVRLQTGDPALYGALIEMTRPLDEAGVEVAVIPGVSSATASAAAAVESLTLPEVTQTVIFTRMAGRTPMPEGESLAELARSRTTICLYLSATLLDEAREAFVEAGWSDEDPVVIVHKASWPGEEKIFRTTIDEMASLLRNEKIAGQTMVIASPALGARHWPELATSKLYDARFSHRYRKGANK